MIIFLDEDVACRHWLTHHRRGYAVEGMRSRKPRRLVLHAAVCTELKETLRRGRATTHRRQTACSLRRDELIDWCATEYAAQPTSCETCLPADQTPAPRGDKSPLTRIDRDVLDYVLDVAVIHLEPDAKPYHLTVADVAQCLHKTPGQLGPALGRLVEQGLIIANEPPGRRRPSVERREISPTAAALQMLPYFADRSRRHVEAEVAKLHPFCDPTSQPSE